MATLEIVQPEIIQFEFRQEKTDPDYGNCMWATFRIDTKNYDLMIMSDCGNYAYGWHITPTESFLHLLSRLDEGYLLEKLSSQTVVDAEATLSSIKKLIADYGCEDEVQPDWDEIEGACVSRNGFEVVAGLMDLFKGTEMENCDIGDIYNCIEIDYPTRAKKIVEIFEQYVAPKCKELEEH
ncbi:MAG: hypothetical protein RR365_14195 [Bacteroides sp.]